MINECNNDRYAVRARDLVISVIAAIIAGKKEIWIQADRPITDSGLA